jgi:hypothetical protein
VWSVFGARLLLLEGNVEVIGEGDGAVMVEEVR